MNRITLAKNHSNAIFVKRNFRKVRHLKIIGMRFHIFRESGIGHSDFGEKSVSNISRQHRRWCHQPGDL